MQMKIIIDSLTLKMIKKSFKLYQKNSLENVFFQIIKMMMKYKKGIKLKIMNSVS